MTAARTLVSAAVSVLLLLHMQPEDSTELGNEPHLSHCRGGELCTTVMKALPWALPPQPGVHARKSSKGDLVTGRQQQWTPRRRLSDVVCNQLWQPQWKRRESATVPPGCLEWSCEQCCVTLLKATPEGMSLLPNLTNSLCSSPLQ